jgi:hypothetical protein
VTDKHKCQYFTGMINDKCEKGIAYESVRETSQAPYRFPCFDADVKHMCPHHQPYTAEEIEQQEREAAKAFEAFAAMIAGTSDKCPHCGKTIEKKEQVGRCVYGRPCGCRLYQGRLPK